MIRNMAEYTVIVSEPRKDDEFVKAVNAKIKDGWQPLCPPSIVRNDEDWELFAQIMVKYEVD